MRETAPRLRQKLRNWELHKVREKLGDKAHGRINIRAPEARMSSGPRYFTVVW